MKYCNPHYEVLYMYINYLFIITKQGWSYTLYPPYFEKGLDITTDSLR